MARKRRLISSKGSLAGAKHLQKRQLARSRKERGVKIREQMLRELEQEKNSRGTKT